MEVNFEVPSVFRGARVEDVASKGEGLLVEEVECEIIVTLGDTSGVSRMVCLVWKANSAWRKTPRKREGSLLFVIWFDISFLAPGAARYWELCVCGSVLTHDATLALPCPLKALNVTPAFSPFFSRFLSIHEPVETENSTCCSGIGK